jgi:TPR repeat protein
LYISKLASACFHTCIPAIDLLSPPPPNFHNTKNKMANREELAIIRGARAGRADAQLALGKLYLFGSAGLPKSLPTALHWLDRAARQECAEAWKLIGSHIPLDLAQRSERPLASLYERAYDDGIVRAGLVFAQLVLEDPAAGAAPLAPTLRAKALQALEEAAQGGFAEAQWLLARQDGATPGADGPAAAPGKAGLAEQRWLHRAADNGVAAAQYTLLEQTWQAGDRELYLARALPLAQALVVAAGNGKGTQRPSPDEVILLSRCARLLAASERPQVDADELHRFWELAAAEHDCHAQLALGLWYARMRVDGKRVAAGTGSANFKKAIRWLTLAGEQGLAEAWYALSRIFIKPEFSQRNVADAQKYLERAAEMGYRDAQLERGNNAWRARREKENNDVRAVYWLQKAAGQGCAEAAAALCKIAPRLVSAAYTETGALLACGRDVAATHPLLAARLELAALFNLTRAEALLLDVKAADQGHCLVIDIRASYGRSKRRLVAIETVQERQALDRLSRLFDNVDCGPSGPEGNYRQRLYRLRTLMLEGERDGAGLAFEMAA